MAVAGMVGTKSDTMSHLPPTAAGRTTGQLVRRELSIRPRVLLLRHRTALSEGASRELFAVTASPGASAGPFCV